MSASRGCIVIFKAPPDSAKEPTDEYRNILSDAGFHVINVPVLDFEYVNLDDLLSKVKTPEKYSGIIFSSPRCVKSCELAAGKEPNPVDAFDKWKNHCNFAVGEATARLAESMGLNCLGKESGNANALADLIMKSEFNKPFLYPIGSLTNNNFKERLKSSHIAVDDIVVYNTKPSPDLERNISDLTHKIFSPTYFLYFSPSGIHFTLPILQKGNIDLKNIRFIAIGPTTEKGLTECGLEVHTTVKKPTPLSVLEALLEENKG